MKKEKTRTAKTFDEMLDIKYGKVGTPKRDKFERKIGDSHFLRWHK